MEVVREASTPLPEDFRPGTLVDLFLSGLDVPREDALCHRRPDGHWAGVSSAEVGRRVRELALGLRSLGLERGDRVAILSHTRLEWALADFATVMAGLTSVPVYPVLPAEQIRYVLADAGVRAAFLSDSEQLAKLRAIEGELSDLERVIRFAPGGGEGEDETGLEVQEFQSLAERGRAAEAELGRSYESHARATRPDDLATLIYTSGTTGPPKGVMLSHANIHSNVVLALRGLPIGPGDRALSLLPLAHVFERTVGQYAMWYAGVAISYAESPHTVARDLAEVRPTLMAAVPRVYEKVLERVEASAREAGGLRERIFGWARAVGERAVDRARTGVGIGGPLGLQARIADRLVFRTLRERTGGAVRYFISGGAPLSPAVARFFMAAKLPIVEGYGLTETSPILTFNPVEAIRIGTVGRPIPGTSIRIAADGEVLARGPQVMIGYYRRPEATAEAIDPDGWFHTGDVGSLDEDGYLRITDRKKDLIITAYGKNIAPQPIEAEIKRDPLIAEAVMLGDGRKFPIVLVVPAFDEIRRALPELEGREDGALATDPRVVELLENVVKRRVSGFAHYERPREILPVPVPFSVEGGELTPTLKVKRRVVAERWADEIDALYARAESEGPDREGEGLEVEP